MTTPDRAIPSEERNLDRDAPDRTWIVIPAFNEEETVAAVVSSLEEHGYSIVVVDDGSEDETYARIESSAAHLVRHGLNLGQGAALQTGIRYALDHDALYIVTFDADGQHRAEDVPRLLGPLLEGMADLTLGSRFLEGGRAVNIPKARRVALRLATLLTRLTTGLSVTDAHNGLRAFTARAAEKIRITQHRMAHASQIMSEIRRHRLRYREVPVTIVYTEYSIKKGQRIVNAFNILWDSIMEVFR